MKGFAKIPKRKKNTVTDHLKVQNSQSATGIVENILLKIVYTCY